MNKSWQKQPNMNRLLQSMTSTIVHLLRGLENIESAPIFDLDFLSSKHVTDCLDHRYNERSFD